MGSPPSILMDMERSCFPLCSVNSMSNPSNILAVIAFICITAISFPRHILGPAWNTGYWNALLAWNTPISSHLSGLYSPQSFPHMTSALPIA
ncbi:hypothetical protein OPV22_002197 [Ensete ventricosum]|uniref:Uncharacterized protein n=1 Tax=Ensete ventricosum TaxID=4639 RepID=A0AAV8RX94_ENSVE|nr:hypothetical protein OPV22_002197 [Ensete ventricosum]